MLGLFEKIKKHEKVLDVNQVIQHLIELNPPSVLVFLEETTSGRRVDENLGKAFFLQRDKRIYTDANHLYITTPEDLKVERAADFRGKGELFTLQFMHRRVPYKFECRVVGRFRLLPEIVEMLDFKVRSAYKLYPASPIRKEDKRNFLRYIVKNYGDTRIPLTTHLTFDVFLKPTNQEVVKEGAPPTELNDLRLLSSQPPGPTEPFTARAAIDEFRQLMLKSPPGSRHVHLSKVIKGEAKGNRRPKDEIYLLGMVEVLGLDQEIRREVIYTKRSSRSDFKKDNPYNLHPGDKVLVQFFQGNYYSLYCEVLEARTQNEVLRPRSLIQPETGLKVELVEFSVGGALIESSPQLLRLLLGEQCPPDLETEQEFRGRFWDYAFERIKRHLIHLTFYPKFHFPEKLKAFQPELPFAIPIIAQVVRPQVHRERRLLQFGVRFVYDQEGIPLLPNEPVRWRLLHGMRDNLHFTEVHSKLSQLYGYLEAQSLARAQEAKR